MGGVWGIAVSNTLENLPIETRGLASGILAQGYAVGYLVSIIMNTYVVPDNRHTWSVLFWIGSGMMVFAAYVRAVLPESPAFLYANSRRVEQKSRSGQECSAIREVGRLLKTNWKSTCLCVAIVSSA
jgi:SHS family lactate transporter-like MFS transporter